MQRLLFACALSASLFGCKKKDDGGGSKEGAECITAAQQVAPLYLAGAKKTKPDTKVTELELTGHVNATCTLDGWSPDVIKCFDGVKSEADLTACDKKLSKDQADKLDKALLEAFAGEAGSAAAPLPAASSAAPAAGSADGSGSAAAPAADGSAAGSGSGS